MGKRQAGGNFFKKAAAAIKSTGLVGKAVGALAPLAGKAAKAVGGDTAGDLASSVVSGNVFGAQEQRMGTLPKGTPPERH